MMLLCNVTQAAEMIAVGHFERRYLSSEDNAM
jgi:hypothetical protein